MLIETGNELDKEMVLKTVTCCLRNSINYFIERGIGPQFFSEIDHLLAFKGEHIEVELGPNSVVKGKLIGLDRDGSLLLEMCQREIWKINGGRILRVISKEKN